MPKIRTYLDAGVLIAGHRGHGIERLRALALIGSPPRVFLSSIFLELEVLPKPSFHRKIDELAFYRRYFDSAVSQKRVGPICLLAHPLGQKFGLSALDALHVSAARLLRADEFITTEGKSKPLHRATIVSVYCLFRRTGTAIAHGGGSSPFHFRHQSTPSSPSAFHHRSRARESPRITASRVTPAGGATSSASRV